MAIAPSALLAAFPVLRYSVSMNPPIPVRNVIVLATRLQVGMGEQRVARTGEQAPPKSCKWRRSGDRKAVGTLGGADIRVSATAVTCGLVPLVLRPGFTDHYSGSSLNTQSPAATLTLMLTFRKWPRSRDDYLLDSYQELESLPRPSHPADMANKGPGWPQNPSSNEGVSLTCH